MGTENPTWLEETRDFCRSSGIKIVGWGPDMLTVEAKTDARVHEIASQLGQLGFQPIQDEDNAKIGWLDLSKNPAAIQAKNASLDVSRRLWDEQVTPLIWALGSILVVPGLDGDRARIPYWLALPMGLLSMAAFFREGARIWGWKLEILPEAIRVRRYFRWSTIPWEQIHAVLTVKAGRSDEKVLIKLASHSTENLGSFGCAFARRLRDRLRTELAHHSSTPTA